jgi:polysaccharide biosynthesis PFTS motif protein
MISTSDSYAAFQRRLDIIFADPRQLPSSFLGYSQRDIASRITQICAEGVFDFTRIAAEAYRKNGSLPADHEQVNCGGIFMDVDGGVRLTTGKFLRLLIGFFKNWCYNFLSILFSLRLSCLRRQVTLLYGVGLQDLLAEGSDARFLNFCRSGPIVPLVTSDCIFIQAQKDIASTEPLRVKFVSNPLLMALRQSGLDLRAWTYALAQHFRVGCSFIWGIYRLPVLVMLGGDAINHAIASVLNRQHILKDVVFTTSNLFSQPLWFWALSNRAYSSHIVWYSQNNYPISYENEFRAVPFPNLRYIKADIQWVWSEGFRDFLSSLCSGSSYRVVGPIVWHLPSGIIKTKGDTKTIVMFDVTPISQETENKLGQIRNFYTEKNATMFIEDIVKVASDMSKEIGVEIEVLLKHKRPHHSIHSSEYIKKVSDLVIANQLKLIDPFSNLYDLILHSDLVIVYPYSSPIILAKELRKDAFWYDPTSTLKWMLGAPEFSLVHGKSSLAIKMRNLLSKI